MKHFVTMMMVSLFAAGTTMAQGLDITGAGARAEGFGGAFIGVADDATAIVWNPAGLTQLERAEASVVTRIVFDKAEYTNSQDPSLNSSPSQSHFVFNFGSFALPFKLGNTAVVIAAAYQRQIDLYLKLQDQSGTQEGKGGVDTFTPALSIKLAPVLSVGAAANIWTGTHDLTLTSANRSQKITQSLPYKGFNMVFGGLLDLEALPQPVPIKFGVTVRTPFELKAEGTQKYDPPFIAESGDISQINANRTVQMPLMLGFGASVRLTENFTIAADYEIRSYKDKELTDELVGFLKTTSKLSASNENLNQFRVGAEYLFVAKNYVIPLRIGYKTVPTLLANTNEQGGTDQVSGKAISIGSGFISNAFAIDVAYTATDYTETATTGSTSFFLPALVETTKYTTGTISASVIVYF